MPLRAVIVRDYDQMSAVAAEFIETYLARVLAARAAANLGLAAGKSPVGVYQRLAAAAAAGRLDPARIHCFNLDEYVGLPGRTPRERARHPESYATFMHREFFRRLPDNFAETLIPQAGQIDPEQLERELQAHPADWTEQGADRGKAVVIRRDAQSDYLRNLRQEILDAYEEMIRSAGGLDLQILGVGERGHVGFHESGIPFPGNRMLLVHLDANTRQNAVADGHFSRLEACPRYAVSMGVELIFEARNVVLLASGARKSEALARALAEEPGDAVPASYGQVYARRGGDMLCVLDRAAAAGVLARRGEIEARGITLEDRSA